MYKRACTKQTNAIMTDPAEGRHHEEEVQKAVVMSPTNPGHAVEISQQDIPVNSARVAFYGVVGALPSFPKVGFKNVTSKSLLACMDSGSASCTAIESAFRQTHTVYCHRICSNGGWGS